MAAVSQRTFNNALYLTLGAFAEAVLQFVFLVVAGRQLGPAEFGYYGFLLAVITFAVTFAHFGLPVVSVREIAQRPADEHATFIATFRIRCVIAVGIVIAAVVGSSIAPMTSAHRLALILTFAYLLFLPFDLSFLFDARKMSRWDVPAKLGGRAASVALLLVLWQVRGRITVVDVALCSSSLMLVSAVIGWRIAKRQGLSLKLWGATGETKHLVLLAMPVVWSNLMSVTNSQSQTMVMKALAPDTETGYYALASRLMLPLLIVKGIVYRLMLPILSEVATRSEALTDRLEKILPALALLFMPAAALAIPAAETLLVPLFGASYAGAVLPFQISVSLLWFAGFGSALGTAILTTGDARTPTIGLTIGSLTGAALCVWLIPEYGASGAAWAAWIGEFIAIGYTIPKFLRVARPKVSGRIARIGGCAFLGTASYYLITRALDIPLGIGLAISMVITVGLLWIVREISYDRLRTVAAMIRPGMADSGANQH